MDTNETNNVELTAEELEAQAKAEETTEETEAATESAE